MITECCFENLQIITEILHSLLNYDEVVQIISDFINLLVKNLQQICQMKIMIQIGIYGLQLQIIEHTKHIKMQYCGQILRIHEQ